MRIRQVDFPATVLEAQRSDKLVVFAGAGVSIDPPSNYPNFEDLASQVGGKLHPKSKDEAIDRYLGKLASVGVTVHDRVRDILSSPDSKPNSIHNDLVRIFRNPEQVRIVTTNFDRHFTTVLNERFQSAAPEIFNAPALPIGSDFNGLAYLHGSVEKHSKYLVLTDSDFGRAYITEGWATRFLERLFSRYVVLFIGYSHQDVLMTYLARGLSAAAPGPGRYVLTPADDDAKWDNLGIIPIHYPLSEAPQPKHQELSIALTAWAEQSQAGALAVEERVQRILMGAVPLTPEDDDYLRNALLELSTLRFFTRYARGTQWLKWIELQPAFKQLFGVVERFSPKDDELASWFAGNFVLQHTDDALDVIRRKGNSVPVLIWQEIALVLFRNRVHGEVLSKWVAILVTSPVRVARNDVLEFVLSHCSFPEDTESALLLFEYLTRPVIHLKESLRWPSENSSQETPSIRAELKCIGDEHWLHQTWDGFFAGNLASLGKSIEPIVTSQLMRCRRLLAAFGKADESWDQLSMSRGMVESREQDHLYSGFSTLIDAGAGLIRWASIHDPEWAEAIVRQWFNLDSQLLRRLAIFGNALSTTSTPDQKLEWLIESKLLYKLGFKHEIFMLIEKAYPLASATARQTFLTGLAEQHHPSEPDSEMADYELFNVVGWLARVAPNCEQVKALLQELRHKNPTFSCRDHPDMDFWVGPVGYAGIESSYKEVELESYDVDQLLKAIDSAPNSAQQYPTTPRDSLMYAISRQAQSTHEWGIEIARQARERSIWSPEIWQQLIGAWASTDLDPKEWADVLSELLRAVPVYHTVTASLASLLERGMQNASKPIPTELLDQAKAVADQVWIECLKVDDEDFEKEFTSEQFDSLAKAINHPSGQLFEFYIQGLSRLQKEKILSEEHLRAYEEIFLTAINGSTLAGQLACVILAAQIQFLFYIIPSWTKAHVFPLLDPAENPKRAKRCWHGYLYWGRWTDPMLADLLKLYEAMFRLIESEKDEFRRIFCGHLAGIAVYASINPIEEGWLSRFLLAVAPITRATWASQMHAGIGKLESSAKLNLWQRWLKKYWEERLLGLPTPLTPPETAEMMDWVLDLDPVVGEVVDLICAGPYPDVRDSMIYYPIANSDLLRKYPDAFAKLLLFLASGDSNRPVYDSQELYHAVELLAELIPRNPQVRLLCDELSRLGIPGAAILAARLQPPKQDEY